MGAYYQSRSQDARLFTIQDLTTFAPHSLPAVRAQVGQPTLYVQRARLTVEGGGLVAECPERGDVLLYHLVFVTDGRHDAMSTDIGVYNQFVNDQADLNPLLAPITWSAIASTEGAAARDNALISGPVFRLDAVQVATGFADTWDGGIANPINVDQFGNVIPLVQIRRTQTSHGTYGLAHLQMARRPGHSVLRFPLSALYPRFSALLLPGLSGILVTSSTVPCMKAGSTR